MTAAEVEDPTGDTRLGVEITAKETRRHTITGTAQYLVADVVVLETETTSEVVVREGDMVQTPTPPSHQDWKKIRAADRPVGKELGRRRRKNRLRDGDKIFVRPCHQGAHSETSHRRSQDMSETCHCGTHSEAIHHSAHSEAMPLRCLQ